MKFYLLLLLVILSHVYAGDAISGIRAHRQASPGYIIRLVPTCPASESPGAVGKLELQADVPSDAQAFCKNGNLTFSSVHAPIYELPVVLSSPSLGQCQLFQKVNVSVYTAHVIYGWGDPGSPIFTYTKQELVTCSYNGYGTINSTSHNIQEFPVAPRERGYFLGNHTLLPVTLSVIDILDQTIDGRDIIVGRTIRLRADVGANLSQSVRAVSCFAQNSAGASHAVIRGGCGDGMIFKKGSGFTTVGNKVHSPYFKTFKLKGANDLKFNCTFVICAGNCDGSSCPVVRRKRDIAVVTGRVLVHNPEPPRVAAVAMILVHERLRYITISTSTSKATWKQHKAKPQSQIKVISFERLKMVDNKGAKKTKVLKSKSLRSSTVEKVSSPSISLPEDQAPKQTLVETRASKISPKLVQNPNLTDTVMIDTDSYFVLPEQVPQEGQPKAEEPSEFQVDSPNVYVDDSDKNVQLLVPEGRLLNELSASVLRVSSGIITLDSPDEEEGIERAPMAGYRQKIETIELGTGKLRIVNGRKSEQDENNKYKDGLLLIEEPESEQAVAPTAFSINSFTFFVAMTICVLIGVILIASGMYLCRRGRGLKDDKLDIAIITTAQDINKITKDFEDVKIDKSDIACACKPDVTSHVAIPPPKPSDKYITNIMGNSTQC